jgi:two-component system invasion response regulator UvrY
MIRVLIADDHSLVRQGLKRILEEASDIRVVAEASDGLEAVREYERVRPDVAVLDIAMPHKDGLDTIKQLVSIDPDARILVLTMYPEEQFAVRTLRTGALGYITKGSSTSELHRAVRTVRYGRRYLSDQGENAVNLQLLANRSEKTPVGSLSNRELQVLCLIARGYKSSKISVELGLSTKTIETYRARLMQKLCLQSDADICRFAYDNKLVEGTAPAIVAGKPPDTAD